MKDWSKVEADVDKIMNVHYTAGRAGAKVDKIVLHHNAGRLTVEQCWNIWQTRAASAHYHDLFLYREEVPSEGVLTGSIAGFPSLSRP
jgi:hypothetical protein